MWRALVLTFLIAVDVDAVVCSVWKPVQLCYVLVSMSISRGGRRFFTKCHGLVVRFARPYYLSYEYPVLRYLDHPVLTRQSTCAFSTGRGVVLCFSVIWLGDGPRSMSCLSFVLATDISTGGLLFMLVPRTRLVMTRAEGGIAVRNNWWFARA